MSNHVEFVSVRFDARTFPSTTSSNCPGSTYNNSIVDRKMEQNPPPRDFPNESRISTRDNKKSDQFKEIDFALQSTSKTVIFKIFLQSIDRSTETDSEVEKTKLS